MGSTHGFLVQLAAQPVLRDGIGGAQASSDYIVSRRILCLT
jgi:hypothetical protein